MKHMARKWMAIAMAIALVFGCALAETDADALFEEGKAAFDALEYDTALEKLSQVAEDNPEAQFLLGDMYRFGYGVEADLEKAVELYQRAADSGDADGKAEMGLMYAQGNVVEQDHERAVALYNEGSRAAASARGRCWAKHIYRATAWNRTSKRA